nr:amidase [Chthonobacter rhizosphaerae]
MTLLEAAAAIRERRVSSVELTAACLARAEDWQPVANAFIAIEAETALATAARADAALAAGEPVGPFHGVPLAHKDMLYRPGRVTGCGSRIRAASVESTTATVLARLDAAGAVDLGRLNMSEFALGPTGLNHHHGRARNPWDPAVVTGGSSSGSGAAVAAGLAFGAIGSDTGGSIRLPAALCGIAGLKPTQGRVSRYGAMPLSFSQDCLGPMAPTVADVAAFYGVIAGADPLDPTSAAVPVDAPAPRERLDGVTVGVSSGWLQDLDAETAAAHEEAHRALRDLGASLVDVQLPDPLDLGEFSNIVAMTEAAAIHGDWIRERPGDYGPQVLARLRQGMVIPGALYLRAIAMRAPLLERVVAAYGKADALVLPVVPFVPPTSADMDGAAGAAGVAGAAAIPQMVAAMARYTRPISYLGLPSLAQPIGRSQSGLPIAMQTVGRPFAEAAILSVGMAYEVATGQARRALPSKPDLAATAA